MSRSSTLGLPMLIPMLILLFLLPLSSPLAAPSSPPGSPGGTVWTHFGGLVSSSPDPSLISNLGQGFPDSPPPAFVRNQLQKAMEEGAAPHQYTRSSGHPLLVKELASRYSQHLARDLDPLTSVAITVGASQALYLSLQSLISPGDEVVIFEPYFDLYLSQVKLAGGTPVFVPLDFTPFSDPSGRGGEWTMNPERLKAAVGPRTRCVILNSPHNPTGKVFTRGEMQDIADAISPFPRAVVLSDEVYKFIVHSPPALPPGAPAETVPGHTHFASLPGMYERTLTISSAGKTFSATGWQVGWAIGPESLIAPIQEMLPSVQFCASTLMQEAIAKALPLADEEYEDPASGKKYVSYYAWLLREYTEKRDFLVRALEGAGFRVPDYSKVAGGGFFIFAQVTDEITSEIPADVLGRECAAAPGGRAGEGWALCEYLLESKGVGLIPASPFFSTQSAANEQFVRVAFCKNRKVIEEAGRALLCTSGGGEEGEEEDSQCQALLESASLT